jgi:hypothetical protein
LEVDFDVGPDEELELDGVGLADEELEELDVEELEGVGDEELCERPPRGPTPCVAIQSFVFWHFKNLPYATTDRHCDRFKWH